MSLDLTLFQIEDGLRDLYAMREEASTELELGAAYTELELIDAAIQKHIAAEIKKVDGTADFILMLDRLCHEQRERKGSIERCEIDREIDRLKARRDSLRGVLAHVKDTVKFVMEGMSWREGKPKKLEGVRHSITLRGNGGAQPVEITDESLVPDEYCRFTVTLSGADFRQLLQWADAGLCDDNFAGDRIRERIRLDSIEDSAKREVSKSAIAEALNRPCPVCNDNEIANALNPCNACGGSGKQGVPGARLAPRGESLQIR